MSENFYARIDEEGMVEIYYMGTFTKKYCPQTFKDGDKEGDGRMLRCGLYCAVCNPGIEQMVNPQTQQVVNSREIIYIKCMDVRIPLMGGSKIAVVPNIPLPPIKKKSVH